MSVAHVFTIGHSNRDADSFLELLDAHRIERIIDVRSFPRSKRNPHFNREPLRALLSPQDIAYDWLGRALGGFRKPRDSDRHPAIAEEGFRGYAEHMASDEFKTAIDTAIELGTSRRSAIMCAEADPASCHRRFIADYLVTRGVTVIHITGVDTAMVHTVNADARLEDGVLVYDRNTQKPLF